VKNRLLVIFLIAFLSSAGTALFPSYGFTQEKKTVEGMVQIDRNHLYMISIGSEQGVAKGDIVEIYRLGVKVSEARLISVLSDSSMAEILKFINVTSIFESDTVHYTSKLDASPKIRSTLSSRRPTGYEDKPDISITARDRKQRGLLGSDTSINQQVQLARAPLQKEIDGLRVGMDVIQEEYAGKMEAVLKTTAGGRARSVVAIEKKWRKKFDASTGQYEEKLSEQRKALEADYAKEKEGLERKIESLKRQMSQAGEVGDKRVQQLLGDVKSSDALVNELRYTFEEERTLEAGRWMDKIAELEQKYQNQLRIQKGEYEAQISYHSQELKGQISELQNQVLMEQKGSKDLSATAVERLDRKQNVINKLKVEKFELEKKITKKNTQIVNSKKDVIDIKDELAKTKSVYSERIKAAKKPLETHIEKLIEKLAAAQKSHDSRISLLKDQSRENLLTAKEDGFEKAATIEGKLQRELNALKANSESDIKHLKTQLNDRKRRIGVLEKDQDERSAKLSHNAKEIKQLGFSFKTVKSELVEEVASRDRVIADETRGLRKEVNQLNDEVMSIARDYERQIMLIKKDAQDDLLASKKEGHNKMSLAEQHWQARKSKIDAQTREDAALIKFLNEEMGALTGDLEDREQQLVKNDKDISRLEKDLTKTKDSISTRVRKTKEPLEKKVQKLNEELDALKRGHKRQVTDIKTKTKEDILASQDQSQAKLISELKKHQEEIGGIRGKFDSQNSDLMAQMDKLKEENEQKIAALGEQINALRGDSDSAISILQDQLTEKESLISTLERESTNLDSKLQKKNKQLAKFEDKITNLNENITETKLSNSEKIKFAKLSLGEKIDELNNELVAVNKRYIEEINGLKRDNHSITKNLKNQLTESELLRKSLENENSILSSDLQNRSDQLAKFEDNIAELNENLAETQLSHSEKIQFAKLSLEEKTSELNDELLLVNRRHIEEINSLKEGSHNITKELKNQLTENAATLKTLEEINSNLNSNLQAKDDQLAKFEDSIAELNESLAETQLSHSEKIQFAKLSLEEKTSELNDELVSVNRRHIEEINSLKEGKHNITKELTSQLTENAATLKTLEEINSNLNSNLQAKDDQLAKFEDNIADLNRQLTSTEKSYENQIEDIQRRAGNDLSSTEGQWQTKLAMQEGVHQKKINDLTVQVNTLKGDSDTIVRTLKGELDEKTSLSRSLKSKNTELSSNLQKRIDQLVSLEGNITQLSEDFKDAKSSQSKKIKYAKLPLEEKIIDLDRTLVAMRKKHQDKIEDIQREARDDLLKSQEDSQGKNAEREVRWEEKVDRLRDQYRDEISSLNDQLRASRDGSDRRVKVLDDDLQREKHMVANLKLDATNLQLDYSENERQIVKTRREVEELKDRLNDKDFSTEKRMALAKESMAAEIKMLRSELAFARDNHQENVDFLKERSENDYRIVEERGRAELGASEARWKVKWASREEEQRQELIALRKSLESQLTGNRGELKKTISDLSDRLAMLKNSSDNQVRELEDELVSREYQLGLRDSESQRRMTDVESRWAVRLADAQKQNLKDFEGKKQQMAEEYLIEKRELRLSVIDLTGELRDLRDASSKRITRLESDLDKREFKLGFMENNSQQNTFEVDEKWRAKLVATEEKYKREMINQKHDIEARYTTGKNKQQAMVDDLSGRIEMMKEQFRVNLALKDEELAAELALTEGKHQKELTSVARDNSTEIVEQLEKVKFQKGLIDSLERQKSDLEFDLKQKERELNNTKSSIGSMRKEAKMIEVSQSERMRLSIDTSKAKIEDLSAQLAVIKKRALNEQMDLEDRWKEKLDQAEDGYVDKLNIQRKNLRNKIAGLTHRLDMSVKDGRSSTEELREELRDNQTLMQLLNREKYDLTTEIDGKDREIVVLNEDIINLKENLDTYKDIVSSASSSSEGGGHQTIAPDGDLWYDENSSIAEYHSIIRKAIFSNFQKFDFSAYADKEGVVKIDFELSADGSPKKGPKFIGTEDEGLKDLLMQCFKEAAPFPPFPKELKKASQRFALSISFKK